MTGAVTTFAAGFVALFALLIVAWVESDEAEALHRNLSIVGFGSVDVGAAELH